MFVLHIDLQVKPEQAKALNEYFAGTFGPAISKQEGFVGTQLLRPIDGKEDYCLTVEFDSQELQQKWVASAQHQNVWPSVEAMCRGYSLRKYEDA